MAVRIYSLAKELKVDSKELVDLCTQIGIGGKGSALASLSAGIILTTAGYAALGIVGATLLVIPVAAVLGLRTRISPAESPG